jgi:DNA-binding NarL/FixJ family response regulator
VAEKITPDQAREIAQLIADGQHHAAIAARYGISSQSVGAIKSGKRWADAIDEQLGARMRAAAPGTVLDAGRVQQVISALESGRSGRSIAEEFGISASMVSAIKHGNAWGALDPGLSARLAAQPKQGKALVASQVAQIKQRLLEGQSSRMIAAEYGVSASTVLAIARGKTWADVPPSGVISETSTAFPAGGRLC